MNGKRAKRLRRESINDQGVITRPHPGRKHGGTIGVDAGSLGTAAARLSDELARRFKELTVDQEVTP